MAAKLPNDNLFFPIILSFIILLRRAFGGEAQESPYLSGVDDILVKREHSSKISSFGTLSFILF